MIRQASGSIGIAFASRGSLSARTETLLRRIRERLPREPLVRLSLAPDRWTSDLAAVVVVTPPGDPRGAELRRNPPLSPPVRTVFFSDGHGEDARAVDKAAREISGWVRAIKLRPPLGPPYLRPRLALMEAPLSRRELLTSARGIRQEVVPAVEPGRCVGWERCHLCVKTCSPGAIGARGDRAVIDQRRCTGCGACLGACPVDAIRFPGGTKEEIDVCLRELLSPGGAPAASRIVAFTCARAIEALPPPYLELPLPCVALVTPWAILRALSLGATGVAVITGNSPCRDRHDPEGLEREIRASGKILEALGVEANRIVGLDAPAPPGLLEFETLLGRMSRVPWQGDGALPPPLGLGSLVARMVRAMPEAAPRPALAPELPFASVEVDPAHCSLCGLCALCPGGAIERHEEADGSALTFQYARCTGCALCREICPEQAIRITPVLAPARLLAGPHTLVTSRLVRCQSCRSPIAPAFMLEAVARRMAGRRGAPQVLPEISRFCPACRLSVPIGESVLPQAGAPIV